MEKQAHLLELCRYVVLNPVRARGTRIRRPEDWPWSSYRATVGVSEAPEFLTTKWVLGQFARSQAEAQRAYIQFVEEGSARRGRPVLPTEDAALGSEGFLREVQRAIGEGERERVAEHPRAQRLVGRPALDSLLVGAVRQDRACLERAVTQAYQRWGYRLSQIASVLGVHYSTVSRMVKRGAR